MEKFNDMYEIKLIFDQISSQIKISFVVKTWKTILRHKFCQIINHFYNDYDFRLYEFVLLRENILKNLLIIKDVLIKLIKPIQKTNKNKETEFSVIGNYNKEKIIELKKSYTRNNIFRFFNNASIIKI